jgi:hypothetical protein
MNGFRRQVDGTRSNKILYSASPIQLIDRPIDSIASIRLFVVRLSVSALSLALYILKSGIPLQGYRPIVTYDYSDESRHAGVNGFFRGCPLFSSEYAHVRVGFSDYRSF